MDTIENIKINGIVVAQCFDNNTDSVHFTYNDDGEKDLFIVNSDTETFYIKPGTSEKVYIGKFNYYGNYYIKFVFDDSFFLEMNGIKESSFIIDKSITTLVKDFIKAESHVIIYLLQNLPEVFPCQCVRESNLKDSN